MKQLGLFVIFVIVLSSSATSQTLITGATKAEQIDVVMKHFASVDRFNGTILVSENNKVIYEKAFGVANIATKEPMTTASSFYLASVSKQFTAMSIMILKEKKKLDYNDLIVKYFPEMSAFAKDVTIKHLMTHTSGMPDYFALGLYKPGLLNEDVVKGLVNVGKLEFTPGEKFSYSNCGYVLLAMITEKVSGMPYDKFMDENVFKPAGMNNTLVRTISTPPIAKTVTGYNLFDEADEFTAFTYGDGGMHSTVGDLFLWDQALYTEKIVTQKTLAEAFKPTKLNDGSISNYGFGWGVANDGKNKVVEHSGGLGGFRTYIQRNLGKHNSIIFLSSKGSRLEFSIKDLISGILNNKPSTDPLRVPISSLLWKLLATTTTEDAITQSVVTLKSDPSKYYGDEDMINTLGYALLEKQKANDAVLVFRFNAALFPRSSNAFDSMGEAYAAAGDTTKAIESYRKSFQLNPGNTNAYEILKKHGVPDSELIGSIAIPAALLDTYVGKYQVTPKKILTVTREGSQMFAQATGNPKFEIFPSSETDFYLKAINAQLTFRKNPDGKIGEVVIHQNGDIVAKKIE